MPRLSVQIRTRRNESPLQSGRGGTHGQRGQRASCQCRFDRMDAWSGGCVRRERRVSARRGGERSRAVPIRCSFACSWHVFSLG